MHFSRPIVFAVLFALLPACSDDADVAEMARVSATKPSEDARILDAADTMSDGSPIPPHITETIDTGLEMHSFGAIGGVAVDRAGNIYSTNFHPHVWRISPQGELTLLSDEFRQASGNFAMANGDLLQADFNENVIYRLRPDGERILFSGEGLDGPVGIVQRSGGDFIVANYRGQYLASVPADGGAAEVVLRDERLTGPNGVTIDAVGNIYIADLNSPIVFKWSPDGALIELAELPGKGNAHNVIANGALYVNKIWDHVVYRVELDSGAYGIVSGNGRPGFEDGPTGTATIEEPNGIAVAPDGRTIYFNTHRGLMFEKPGAVILRRLRLAAAE